MPFARSDDGALINYEVAGAGPLTLMLLHGWGGSAAYWREMVRALDLQGLRVIALSYRGHGDSDKPEGGYTLEQFAKDVMAVADDARTREFVLVGFSMSGKFAQYIAATYQSRVLGLVLIAPVPASEFPVSAEMSASWCDSQADCDTAYQRILAPFVRVPIEPRLTEAFLDDFQRADRNGLEATLQMCGVSCANVANHICVPTLVLAGEFDPLLSPDLLRATVLSQVPGSRMITLLCGHELPQEMPGQVAALLEAFVSGLGQPSGLARAAAATSSTLPAAS